MIEVTEHGKDRIKIRCGIKSKGVERMARKVFENGLTHAETTGDLNRYVTSLYFYNETANNIRLYGDKVYIFCNETLVTVLNLPAKFRPIVKKLMDKKREAAKQ